MILIGFSGKDKGLFKWVWSKELFEDTKSNHIRFAAIGFVLMGATEAYLEYNIFFNNSAFDSGEFFGKRFYI